VLNPAVSILLEGCAVYLTLWVMQKRPAFHQHPFINAFSASALYQVFYMIYILIIPNFIPAIPAVTDANAYLKDGLHCIVNALTIFIILKCSGKIAKLNIKLEVPPAMKTFVSVASYVLPILTIFVQWMM
jgi:hypothetical protein